MGKVLGLNPMLVCLLEEGVEHVLDEIPVVFYFSQGNILFLLCGQAITIPRNLVPGCLLDSQKCSISP